MKEINKTLNIMTIIDNYLNMLNNEIEGTISYLHNTIDQFDNRHKSHGIIPLNEGVIKDINKIENILNENRYICVYKSKSYNGNFRIAVNSETAMELTNRLKNYDTKVIGTEVMVEQSLGEKNYLFEIKNKYFVDNIYFTISKIAPQNYVFYYFLDLFSNINFLDESKVKLEILNNLKIELNTLKKVYSEEIIKKAYTMKKMQNDISLYKRKIAVYQEKYLATIKTIDNFKEFMFKLQSLNINYNIEEFINIFENDIYNIWLNSDYLRNFDSNILNAIHIELKLILEISKSSNQNHNIAFETEKKVFIELVEELKKEIEGLKNKSLDILKEKQEFDAILKKPELTSSDLKFNELKLFQNQLITLENEIVFLTDRITKPNLKNKVQNIFIDLKGELNRKTSSLTELVKTILEFVKEQAFKKLSIIETINSTINEKEKLIKKYNAEINKTLSDFNIQIVNTPTYLIEASFSKINQLSKQFLEILNEIYKVSETEYLNLNKEHNEEYEKKSMKYKDFLLNNDSPNLVKIYNSLQNLFEVDSLNSEYLPQEFFSIKTKIEKNILEIQNQINESVIKENQINNFISNNKMLFETIPNSDSNQRIFLADLEKFIIEKLNLIY